MNRNDRHLNPAAGNFKPVTINTIHRQQDSTFLKMTPPSSSYLEARVFNLEEEYAHLRGEVGTLKEKYHQLCHSVTKEKEASGAEVQPAPDVKLDSTYKTAIELGQELEELTMKTRTLTNSEPAQKPVQSNSAKAGYSTASARLDLKLVPPQLCKAVKPDSKIADK